MITVFICEDNKETIKKYSKQLETIAKKHEIQINISAFENGESLVFRLLDSPNSADIIYMDILMGEMNGIETAKKLRELGCSAEIIFLTTSDDYVFEAFDISPVQYLIKNSTTDEKFEQIFLRAVSLLKNRKTEAFIFESGSNRKIIPIKDISFFEIWKRIVTVHYQSCKTFEFYMTMEQLENKLAEKNFVRTHRSYLVNLQYISRFKPQNLTLKTGNEIPIGITYSERVKDAFSKYITHFNIL